MWTEPITVVASQLLHSSRGELCWAFDARCLCSLTEGPTIMAACDCRDTTGLSLPQPRRSSTDISRFSPTLGWLHIVESLTSRALVYVELAVSVELAVPDMWSRTDDDLLV